MERGAFLIESTGERIECLLNPATLTVVRQAGVRTRRTLAGTLSGASGTDDALLGTRGGVTELLLDLLFDVSKQPNAQPDESVQALTAPLWNLAENGGESGGPPRVRFVWGKAWNIPGVVVTVAERFEQFTAAGVPQRSWVRMRLLRQDEPADVEAEREGGAQREIVVPDPEDLRPEQLKAHEVLGEAGDDDAGHNDRIDYLAWQYYGDASMWRAIAAFNGIDDPTHIEPGTQLLLPPVEERR